MSKVRIELNLAGFRELYKSAEIKGALEDAGAAVAGLAEQQAPDDAVFSARVHEADRMAICNVYPDNLEAARNNYKHNTLLEAVGAAGLPTKKPRL